MLTDSDALDCEPSAYRESIRPPAFEPRTRLRVGTRTDRNQAHPLNHSMTAATISSVVQISPPDAVSRRVVNWPGMAGESVQANRRGRINFHFCAPVHMLAMYERSVRHEGGTFIQGLPQSTMRDCSRKLVFVPAANTMIGTNRARSRGWPFSISTPPDLRPVLSWALPAAACPLHRSCSS